MTHRAESITAAVTTTVTGLTTTGSNVFRGRPYDIEASDLPALFVRMGAENKQEDMTLGVTIWQLPIVITGVVKSITTNLETLLNQVRAEVHVALRTDYTLGLSYVYDIDEADPGEPEIQHGDQPIASQEWTWLVQYQRNIDNPNT